MKNNKEDVEPFKNGKKMRLFENELLHHGKCPQEIYLAWQVGKVCLLRVSDVIKLEYQQIYKRNGQIRSTVVTHDKKTKKYNPLNLDPLAHTLSNYRNWRIAHKIHSQWLLPEPSKPNQPLKRQAVYRLIKLSADQLGFKHIRCHSARMTGAIILYKTTNNLAMVSKMLNHSSERITEIYLGLSDPAMKSATNSTDWENIPK